MWHRQRGEIGVNMG
jgi:hypothetical protein